MKTTLWVAAMVVMCLFVAGAYAEEAKDTKAAVQTKAGTVQKIDVEAKTVTVKVGDAVLTVKVTNDTKIVQGDAAKTLADVKADAKVTVEYTGADAELVAVKIVIAQ